MYLVFLPSILLEAAEEIECKLEISFATQSGLAVTLLDLRLGQGPVILT
jgi:hypothetical protein